MIGSSWAGNTVRSARLTVVGMIGVNILPIWTRSWASSRANNQVVLSRWHIGARLAVIKSSVGASETAWTTAIAGMSRIISPLTLSTGSNTRCSRQVKMNSKCTHSAWKTLIVIVHTSYTCHTAEQTSMTRHVWILTSWTTGGASFCVVNEVIFYGIVLLAWETLGWEGVVAWWTFGSAWCALVCWWVSEGTCGTGYQARWGVEIVGLTWYTLAGLAGRWRCAWWANWVTALAK